MLKLMGGSLIGAVLMIEACSTQYSGPIFKDDRTRVLSILMPGNISVYKKSDGKVYAGTMNAGLLGRLFGVGDLMAGVAQDQQKFLHKSGGDGGGGGGGSAGSRYRLEAAVTGPAAVKGAAEKASASCQTCHIPEYARNGVGTEKSWDWSTATKMGPEGKPVLAKDSAGPSTPRRATSPGIPT